jgi:hypothetical protein
MNLRYTLDNDIEGEHITAYSPKGWEDTELVLKRHEKYDGIFKDFVVKADFFCGAGKEYIDNIEETQGVEAVVSILIEIDCDDSGAYETLYSGLIMFDTYEKTTAAPEYSRVNIKQDDIVQTILSRLETKVNLSSLESLNGTALDALTYGPYDLNLHSKEIVQYGESTISETTAISEIFNVPLNDTLYVELPFDTIEVDEIGGFDVAISPHVASLETIASWVDIDPVFINNTGETLSIDFDYNFIGTITDLAGSDRSYTLSIAYKVGSVVFNPSSPGAVSIIGYGAKAPLDGVTMSQAVNVNGTLSLTLTANQRLHMYIVFFNYDNTETILLPATIGLNFSTLSVSASIVTATDPSMAKAFAVFETGAQIARVITDQEDAFRSNYFGRVNSEPFAYDENGCGSFNAITNGLQIRGFPLSVPGNDFSKDVSMSMKEYFEGLSPLHCLGLGVKQDGANTYLEIEPKDHFYTDEVLFNLSNIKNLTTNVEKKFFYNKINIGFNNWRKSEGSTNGLDEFCTRQEYVTLNKNVSQTLDALSDLVAAPYAIETTRRKQFVETATEDTDFDDKNFIIALNRSVDGSDIPTDLDVAEKNENFTGVTNVFSPSTIYNLRYTPAIILRNWYKILGTGLIKLNSTLKTVKFSFGEGNYKITAEGSEACDPAKQELVEAGQDVEILIPGIDGLEPLFTGHVDEFSVPFSLSQYQTLKALDVDDYPNYYKKIGYSTTEEDHLQGYILEVRFKPVRGKADFKTARAYNRTLCSHIYVEEGYVECDYVE